MHARRSFYPAFLLISGLSLSVGVISCSSTPRAATTRPVVGRPTTAPTTAPALAIAHGPYLQAPTAGGMTIVWATNRPSTARVEYGTQPDRLEQVAISAHYGLVDANTTLHSVPLAGLKPGETCYYRVVSTEIVDFQAYKVAFGQTVRSEVRSFTTLDPAKKAFSFIVLNDRHEKVVPLKASLNGVSWDGVDLAFFNGDMYNHLESEQQVYRALIDPCTGIFAGRVPFVLVRGNHDTRGAFARYLMSYFPPPIEPGRYYYSLDHGGVHFVVLDSGEDKADSSPEYSGLVDFSSYLAGETRWLREEVQSEAFRKAAFRVVLVHIPPHESPDTKFIREQYLLDNWGPLLRAGKVDLVLSGHEHRHIEYFPVYSGLGCPMIINGTDTVIRIDVSPAELQITTTRNGQPFTGPHHVGRR